MLSLLENHLASGMLLLGVGILTVLLVRRIFAVRRRRRRPGKLELPQPTLRANEVASAPPQFLRLQVELHELARDVKAEIDTKLSALSAISLIAQERTERLERAIERAEQMEQRLASTPSMQNIPGERSRVPPRDGSPLPLSPHDLRRALRLLDQGNSTSAIANELGFPLGDIELAFSLRDSRTNVRREEDGWKR